MFLVLVSSVVGDVGGVGCVVLLVLLVGWGSDNQKNVCHQLMIQVLFYSILVYGVREVK